MPVLLGLVMSQEFSGGRGGGGGGGEGGRVRRGLTLYEWRSAAGGEAERRTTLKVEAERFAFAADGLVENCAHSYNAEYNQAEDDQHDARAPGGKDARRVRDEAARRSS
jgi:hypothetical protein